jgi:hypothetical protein
MKRRGGSGTRHSRQPVRVKVSPIAELKSFLTVAGDIRSDIAFQNDVNALLATVAKITALGPFGDEEHTPPVDIRAIETPQPRRMARRASDRR